MFSIDDRSPRLCDGMTRRAMIRAGAASTVLGSVGWHRRASAGPVVRREQHAKSCIVLFLMGGAPQHSLFDPKPLAPREVRGEYGPIATAVPGIEISELLPRTAAMMNDVAMLRAVATNDNAHSSSGYQMLTGVPHAPLNVENANPGAPNNWPSFGSVLQELHRGQSLLPPAVRLPHHIFNTDNSVWPGQDSGFLGGRADPWLLRCEPNSPNFDIPHFRLAADLSIDRLGTRRSLVDQLEGRLREADRVHGWDRYGMQRAQALEILSSPRSRQACDLRLETDDTRDRYGRSQFGQSCLLARRLVEAGVEFVHVNWFRGPDEPSNAPCWDSHAIETERLRTVLVPPFDAAFSSLMTDLKQSGRLDEILVLVLSEFGRSPRLDGNGGRGHWGHVFSVAMAGGGIRGGQVLGSSDAQAAWPASGLVTPADLTATIFHCLGYAPETEIHDPLGRPLPISRGRVLQEILA